MKQINYADYKYVVNGRDGYHLTPALRLWKTKYQDDIRDFFKDVITHDQLQDFGLFVEECWDTIEPVTVEEALQQDNTEDRRVFFDAIGVEKLFKSLDPKLIDKQVIDKKRTKWDDDNKEYEYVFEDIYELYELDAKKMFDKDRWGNPPTQHIYAVRCWCTTTNREYWLYVPAEAALGSNWWYRDDLRNGPDAIRAIAWTVRLDVPIGCVERIYRQGDIIVAKLTEQSYGTETSAIPYHLSKENYLQLMYSET